MRSRDGGAWEYRGKLNKDWSTEGNRGRNFYMTANELYNMKCGDDLGMPTNASLKWVITRVPSGWIYTCTLAGGHSVFVPYDNHFAGGF